MKEAKAMTDGAGLRIIDKLTTHLSLCRTHGQSLDIFQMCQRGYSRGVMDLVLEHGADVNGRDRV